MLLIGFSENHFDFLNFWFDAVEQQRIINLNRYESKGYATVVLGNYGVTFLGEREDSAFCPPLYCVLVIYGVSVSEQLVIEFPYLPYFWWYFVQDQQLSCF